MIRRLNRIVLRSRRQVTVTPTPRWTRAVATSEQNNPSPEIRYDFPRKFQLDQHEKSSSTQKREAWVEVQPHVVLQLEGGVEILGEDMPLEDPDGSPIFYTDSHIRQHMTLPLRSDLPNLSESLFDGDSPTSSIAASPVMERLLVKYGIEVSYQVRDAYFECRIKHNRHGVGLMQAIGHGSTKSQAEDAALLHFISRFWREESFVHFMDNYKASTLPRWDNSGQSMRGTPLPHIQVSSMESDENLQGGKITELYDECAKYGLIPKASIIMWDDRQVAIDPTHSFLYQLDILDTDISINIRAYVNEGAFATTKAARLAKKELQQHVCAHRLIGNPNASCLQAKNIGNFFRKVQLLDPQKKFSTRLIKRGSLFHAQVFLNEVPIGNTVLHSSLKSAKTLADLDAALHMVQEIPILVDLLKLREKEIKSITENAGRSFRTVVEFGLTSLILMQKALELSTTASLTFHNQPLEAVNINDVTRNKTTKPLPVEVLAKKSGQLQTRLSEYQRPPDLATRRHQRSQLPISDYSRQIIQMINENTFSIIIGTTGSGKTTQVPQILLDEATRLGNGASCNIVCTQPRRVAAKSVARRVAEERGQPLQDEVGYQVRFDSKIPIYGGSINYCTTGILLQRLKKSPDLVFDSLSHIIIDEVHERDQFIDFLLVVLKKAMVKRLADGKTIPKVVFMSATLNSDMLASYFSTTDLSSAPGQCPTLTVPGRTFPVKTRYLDEILDDLTTIYGPDAFFMVTKEEPTKTYLEGERAFEHMLSNKGDDPTFEWTDKEVSVGWKEEEEVETTTEEADATPESLITSLIAHLARTTAEEGSILVFLPGIQEILNIQRKLQFSNIFGKPLDLSKHRLFILHSSLPDAQPELFAPSPAGTRKIILATNIAESSITVPDVRHVIDTGKVRVKSYDQTTGVTQVRSSWISKSSCRQRKGRAGRVQAGNYYALFSQSRFDSFADAHVPELLRTDLREICLDIKYQGTPSIQEFLADALEPPSPQAVQTAISELKDLGALTTNENLTHLGLLLSNLRVHPNLGKLIVLGIVYRCLDPMIIIAASGIMEDDIFVNAIGRRVQSAALRREMSKGSGSDIIAQLNAVTQLLQHSDQGEQALNAYAEENFLNLRVHKRILSDAAEIERILEKTGLIPTPNFRDPNVQRKYESLNENSANVELIKALVTSVFHPNIGSHIESRGFWYRTVRGQEVMLHPSADRYSRDKKAKKPLFMSYGTLFRIKEDGTHFIRDTSEISPFVAAMFGGPLEEVKGYSFRPEVEHLSISGWVDLGVTLNEDSSISPNIVSRTPIAKTLVDFQRGLRAMEANAFRAIGNRGVVNEGEMKVRRFFVDALVEVLYAEVQDGGAVKKDGLQHWIGKTYMENHWDAGEPAQMTQDWSELVEDEVKDEAKSQT